MKTKEQILAWLDRQSWKYEFYEAAVLSDKACLINYNKNLSLIDKLVRSSSLLAENKAL